MTSKISSRTWVVFKAALKRLKWLSILYGVVLFLEMPMLLWMELSRQKAVHGELLPQVLDKTYLVRMVLNHPVEHLVNIGISVIFGLILFSYLQNDRSSTFFHSLPIKRWSLYCQNLFAGLTLIWLPIILNGLVIYVILNLFGITQLENITNGYYPGQEAINNTITISSLQLTGYWLFISLLMTGLILVFTVFVGMFTGKVLLQGVLTFIGLVLPLGMYLLVRFNFWRLLYGYPRAGAVNDRGTEWLSPLVIYLNDQFNRLFFGNETWYGWYLIIAFILSGASILLYKFRRAEAAGETLAAEWMQYLFKYGVATCAALFGGVYLSSFNEYSTGVLYLGYFIGVLLGYIVADMIAHKSFQFYKRWKGMAVFGLVFTLLILSINLDVYGYERYIPKQSDVKEVFLSNLNPIGNEYRLSSGLTGENINKVRALHQQIIEMEEMNKNLERTHKNQTAKGRFNLEESRIVPIDITYVLNNGEEIKRSYYIDIYRYRDYLYPIFISLEAKKSMYGYVLNMDKEKIDQMNIENHRFGRGIRIYKKDEISKALAALKKDVLNISYETAVEGKGKSLSGIDFVLIGTDGGKRIYGLNYYSEFKNFEAFLEEHGYMDELFLNPEKVSVITIKKLGTDKEVKVTDKQRIKLLLEICYLSGDNEKNFAIKDGNLADEQNQYYGTITLENNDLLFIRFDSDYAARQLLFGITNETGN